MNIKLNKISEGIFKPADNEELYQRKINYQIERKKEVDLLDLKIIPTRNNIIRYISNIKDGCIHYDLRFADYEDAYNFSELYFGIVEKRTVKGTLQTEDFSVFIRDLKETYGVMWNIVIHNNDIIMTGSY